MSTAEALAKASAKQLKTLNTVFDSEGREVVVEERVDKEAKTKFQETIDLLVAAGEFSDILGELGLADWGKLGNLHLSDEEYFLQDSPY